MSWEERGDGHRPCIDKSPDNLLSLKLIPPHLVKHIPADQKPGPTTPAQRQQIKKILNMRHDSTFKRCKGTNRHGKPCGNCAGKYTKGDFYGLGVETGTLGVGFCARCIQYMHIMPGIALDNARREVKAMQTYGEAAEDPDYQLKVAREETALAKASVEQRESVKLVKQTLDEFKRKLGDDEEDLTEYVNGQLVPMSDKTRMTLANDIAKTASKLDLDTVKLDRTKTMPLDEVLVMAVGLKQVFLLNIARGIQLAVRKTLGEDIETDGDITEYVTDIANREADGVVRRMQAKAGQGV